MTTATTDPVKSLSIANLLSMREGALQRVGQALTLLREASAMAARGHLAFPRIEVFCEDGGAVSHRLDESCLDTTMERHIDAGGWKYLMAESGLRTLMDAQARKDWDGKIMSGEVLPLNADNIRETFAALHAGRQDLFERSVINVFRALSWDYQTNKPCAFGRKIILRGLCTYDRRFGFAFDRPGRRPARRSLPDLPPDPAAPRAGSPRRVVQPAMGRTLEQASCVGG